MTNKEAIEVIKSMGLVIDAATSRTRRKSIYKALTLAINALEERPIDDLSEYSDKLWQKAYERGKAERPQGEWQLHGMIYYCSECGHECGESGDNFCGNCGADMRGGRE